MLCDVGLLRNGARKTIVFGIGCDENGLEQGLSKY